MEEKSERPAGRGQKTELLYDLNDTVPTGKALIYGMQHLVAFLASAVVLPVVVGTALELDSQGIAELLQRTFWFGGVAGVLQAKFGHRYPLVDGPAGLWTGMLVLMATTMVGHGKELAVLRTDMELGMIIGGVLLMIICAFGLVKYVVRLFTPLVTGVVIVLMTLQLSPNMVKGMTGFFSESQQIEWPYVAVALVTVFLALSVNLFAKGFLKSIAVLLGVIAGWILSIFLGITEKISLVDGKFITLPEIFPYGRPTFDISVVIICVIGSLVLLALVFAGISGMAEVLGEEASPKKYARSTFIHGLMTLGSGFWPVIGPMPYISSVGIVIMTRVAALLPFMLGCVMMIVLGLFAPVGALFASLPLPVGYGALMTIFALIFGQGLKEFRKTPLDTRECYIIGISVFVGIGVMFLPPSAFASMHQIAGYIFSNGLIDGTILVLLLEHVVLRQRKVKGETKNA